MAFPGRLFALDWNRFLSRAVRGSSPWSLAVPAEGSLFGQSAWAVDRCVFVGGSSALLAALGGPYACEALGEGLLGRLAPAPHHAG